MARANVPLLSFNRGLLSPKALARVDLDRTRLSAEVFTNWLPKSQGAMRIRPGTKYLGSSYSDTGAEWIEFVASTDDTALIEMTHQKMRIWVPSDTGNTWETPAAAGLDVPLARPKVDTTVSLTDTGWSNTSTGGAVTTAAVDSLPTMTAATTNGVTISASSENIDVAVPGGTGAGAAWRAADDVTDARYWADTGFGEASTLPSWWRVDFGASNTQAITSYSIRAYNPAASGSSYNMPSVWQLQRSDDGSSWTTEDTQGSETGWSTLERRTYSIASADTGTIEPRRYWRLNFTGNNGSSAILISEIEMFTASTAQQVKLSGGKRILNATSIGALARLEKRVIVSDTGTEHSLAVDVERGPVTLRVGSTQRDDDYIRETALGTGYHNLAFTPQGNFWVTLQSDRAVNRIVRSLAIGDSGTVEITTHIDAADLANVRYDQSADVVYVACDGVEPHKIERRGTGRSWSWVEFAPDDGPFQSAASSSAKLSVTGKYGSVSLLSDTPFFTTDHVAGAGGALFRLFHGGQSGEWPLGALNAATDAIQVTGISDTGDTGTPSQGSERRITIDVTGTYSGTLQIERSFEGAESGFHPVSTSGGYIKGGTTATDTGTFSRVINDPDDNSKVWYRVRMTAYTSGAAIVNMTHEHGGVYGIARAREFVSNTQLDAEVISRFSDTGSTDSWQEGSWSGRNGYPSSVALHGGRLAHAGKANIYLSVSDDYESHSDEIVGDAAPLSKTLGSGPVDNVHYLLSLLRLIVGTSGAELAVRSSSLDEPLTPENSSVRAFSTQGSSNLRPLKMDTKGIFVQRSGQRLFLIGFGQGVDALGDYEASELTMLVPDLLQAGVVSIAIQRQPDTRIHCVLGNGKVAILTYEPQEEVICWSLWETDGTVEKAMVLPGTNEDQVYYHINRTISGVTKRFLEKWATESESEGDTGLSWIADCAKSYTDTGRASSLTGFSHLSGEAVVVWGDDTGQPTTGRDFSPDVNGVQTTYTVSGAGVVDISATYSPGTHHAVVGLPYTADWKSTKLAYAAEAGTALAQMKRVDKIAFVLNQTHNNGLYFGNDTGNLDPLPRVNDAGAQVDADKIFSSYDKAAMPFPGLWNEDSRIHLRAKAPRPAMVMAAVPTITTNEKV